MTLPEALLGLGRVIDRHGRLGSDDANVADQVEAALGEVLGALGPLPGLLHDVEASDARAARPELRGLESELRLAVPADAVLYPPVVQLRARVAKMAQLGVPDIILDAERARLAELAAQPEPPGQWHRVFVLRDQLADWPGYRKHGELSVAVARRVLPAWSRVFPGDDLPERLLEDAAHALATGRHARQYDLRDQASQRSFEVDGPAGAALRAALAAHDRVTQNPKHDDQTELEYHAEHAWPSGGDAFARWWMAEVARLA